MNPAAPRTGPVVESESPTADLGRCGAGWSPRPPTASTTAACNPRCCAIIPPAVRLIWAISVAGAATADRKADAAQLCDN